MNEVKKNKEISPLIQAATGLNEHFLSLQRLSQRISEIDLKSEYDVNQMQQLMLRFSESAQSVSDETVNLAQLLTAGRAEAEAAVKIVEAKAMELKARQDIQNSKTAAFQILAEKVNSINQGLMTLKKPDGAEKLSSAAAWVKCEKN
ncbi:MAG: hypothetical protein ACXVAX_07740 [Pseudobdellovibrio sp.]